MSKLSDGDADPNADPLGDPLVIRSQVPTRNEDVDTLRNVVLRDSQRVRKEANYLQISDRKTGEYHHDALIIKTTKKLKAGEQPDPLHSISLTNENGEDEIQKLFDFIGAIRSGEIPSATCKFFVVPASDSGDLQKLLQVVHNANANGKAHVLSEVLAMAVNDRELFDAIIARAALDPLLFSSAAAALNLANYRVAVDELATLVDTPNVKEAAFQSHLSKHPWMFGSEHSELLDQRKWTRNESQDFMLRRTTDGFVELVEIKTPLNGSPLFLHDRSHDSNYPGAELSKVLGQVEKYIAELDADRHRILAKDGEDTNKICAKIVIGRNGDSSQSEALRTFNGHLARIEVITFGQLLFIAHRVIAYLERAASPTDQGDPINDEPRDNVPDDMPF